MKRVSCAAATIALVLAATPVALAVASGGLSGTYRTTIAKPASLKGTYRITFTPGHLVLHLPGGVVRRGTDKISGSKITLTVKGGNCKTPGTYKFTLSSTSVTFKKIKDTCSRAVVFTAHPWKKV